MKNFWENSADDKIKENDKMTIDREFLQKLKKLLAETSERTLGNINEKYHTAYNN